jgi:hypothetical protein
VIYYHFFFSLYACNDSEAKRFVFSVLLLSVRALLWPEITAEGRQSARREPWNEEAVGLGSERLCCPCFEVEGLRVRGRSREQIASPIHAADFTAKRETRRASSKRRDCSLTERKSLWRLERVESCFKNVFKMFLRLTPARISSPHHTLILRSCYLLRFRHSSLKKGLSA